MRLTRSDRWLCLAALLGAAVFFSQVARLWPLADANLLTSDAQLSAGAAATLARHGIDLAAYATARRLRVDEPALDYVQRAFGRERAQAAIRDGLPLFTWQLTAKRRGLPDAVSVRLAPDGRVLGWDRGLQEDAEASTLDPDEALHRARAALADLGCDPAAFAERERSQSERPHRRDHRFVFERWIEREPELRERVEVIVAGDAVAKAWASVVVPATELRWNRERAASLRSLESAGFLGLAGLGLAAATVFLVRLGRGQARLAPAAWAASGTLALLVAVAALQGALLFEGWDPLWPRWLAETRQIVEEGMDGLAVALPLLAFLGAADAIDRVENHGARGASLWRFLRGRWTDPGVGAASARGFLVGCICGGALAAVVALTGARVSLQPRGFFLYPLNASAPILATVCFFAQIALFEESAYRFFAGTWLERRSRVLAVVLPAAIYGLAHTGFEFLPPTEPVWARPLALSAVGAVWGVAFLRYDALTVVLSHLAADLFIFTWPRLGSGSPAAAAAAIATIACPLAPALVAGIARWRRPGRSLTAPG